MSTRSLRLRTAHHDRNQRGPRFLARLHLVLTVIWVVERGWKWWRVRHFFRQPAPQPVREPAHELVSIIQPILSGDPTLAESLAATLHARSIYPREWLWLVDDNDEEGLRVCRTLIAENLARDIQLLTVPPPQPEDRRNPKTQKLIAASAVARGTILCVLDDDTRLPDDGLERCLPALDVPGVGLAYGLPYYISFADRWSALIAAFVNSHSLLTYIPPLALTTPFTINGMFYAVRRETLAAVGGFAGLEGTLADDFAVAQRFRAAGYTLAQTPLRHAISTKIAGPRHYSSLIARWFVFPRESILRHVAPRDRAILGTLIIAPTLLPLASLLLALAHPSRRALALLAAGHTINYAIFAHNDRAYLSGATPPRWHTLVPLIATILPLQVGAAFLRPQRIEWRGHVMHAERGGGFRFVQRRGVKERDG